MKEQLLVSIFCALAVVSCSNRVEYPETRRGDVVDDYHGTLVADPYRWLENLDAPDVAAWVEAQNALSQPYLERLPGREAYKRRLSELWNYERYGTPIVKGDRTFFSRNDGLQNQSVLYVLDRPEAEPRVLLDPNTFSEDATVSLGGTASSPRGRYVAYGLSDGGTDWRTWKVRDVDTGENLPDEIRGSKFSIPVAWQADESGFFYSRYPQTADGGYDDHDQLRVFLHRLGQDQEEDEMVFEVTDDPTRSPYQSWVTDDGRFHVIEVYAGSTTNGLLARDLSRPGSEIIPLAVDFDTEYRFVGSAGDRIFVQTMREAPRGRLVAIDVNRTDPAAWEEVIGESAATLEGVSLVGGTFIVRYLEDAKARVSLFALDGTPAGDVTLPGLGSVEGFEGAATDSVTYYTFSSFTTPGSIHRFNLQTGQSRLWRETETVGFDPNDYTVTQEFFESDDGTRMPMFVVFRNDVRKDGNRPALLYGYGGFNVSETPTYSPERMAWLERGGILASANIRGGGEYGEAWHLAGANLNKQQVFDDFIAAAEHLIQAGYTRPERLAIEGASNGGLLVGAVLTQRPDLFGAALPEVGVLDMLRYHTASANARLWSGDFGLSENADEFAAQFAYSPVHNVKEGVCYPPTLVTTADHDDRVSPWHSYKFAAALQQAQSCGHPILLRVETRAGHGAGTPTWMRIEQAADRWAFLDKALGE